MAALCGTDHVGSTKPELAPRRFAWQYLLATASNHQTRTCSRQVAEQHYDLGNQLYRNMLDRRMVYTCGRWDHASGLDEAQEAKLNFVCQKLKLLPGSRLLDIGCGWSSLARFAAQEYGAHVTGITLSHEQLQLGCEMCADLPIVLRLQDYRDLDEVSNCIASLGMFEHVRVSAGFGRSFSRACKCGARAHTLLGRLFWRRHYEETC